MDISSSMWSSFAYHLMGVLPISPFRSWIDYLRGVPYLGYINWFIPMKTVMGVTASWIAAIATYYTFSAILRWMRMVE